MMFFKELCQAPCNCRPFALYLGTFGKNEFMEG